MGKKVKYAGTVSWYNEKTGQGYRKCVSVMGPPEWDPTYFGSGDEMCEAIEAKARKRWPKACCDEAWRV